MLENAYFFKAGAVENNFENLINLGSLFNPRIMFNILKTTSGFVAKLNGCKVGNVGHSYCPWKLLSYHKGPFGEYLVMLYFYLAQKLCFWTGIIFISVYVSVCLCVCVCVCESVPRLSQKFLDRF